MKAIRSYIAICAALLMLCLPASLWSQSQELLRMMEKLDGQEGVSSVLVTKKMFELFAKTVDMEVEGQSLNEVIGGLDELMVIEVGSWQPAAKNLRQEVEAIIKREDFEMLMKVEEEDERVEISILEVGGVISHLFMFIEDEGDSELQLISIRGTIDLEQISRLSGAMNIEGLQHINDR